MSLFGSEVLATDSDDPNSAKSRIPSDLPTVSWPINTSTRLPTAYVLAPFVRDATSVSEMESDMSDAPTNTKNGTPHSAR